MSTTTNAATMKNPTPPHGWRITWPMVLGWLGVLALLWPVLGPYVLGEKPFDTAAGSLILATLLAAINHSPASTKGGGLIFPPATALLVLIMGVLCLSGCGSWSSNARHTIEISATVVDTGDHAVELAIVDTCAPAVHGLAVGPVRTAALLECLAEHHFDDAIDSIDAADHVLRASQSAVDVGERAGGGGDPTGWQALAPCVLDAVHELVQACTTAGVAIPTALVTGLDALTPVVGMCRPPSTSTSIAATAGGESS